MPDFKLSARKLNNFTVFVSSSPMANDD